MAHRVGIDLGTTNSVVAFTEFGRQRCVKVERNEFTSAVMPSAVGILGNGTHAVGAKARRLRNENKIVEFKRHMGEGTAYQLGDEAFTPLELSAMVLQRLREGFEDVEGPIEGAVITVPAMFDERRRRETVEAGRLAGLNVLRVINEPSAAAIAYSLSDDPPGSDALVVDWGGGTLDVSLLDCEHDVLDVKANDGDMHLGGKDFDSLIVERMYAALDAAGHHLRDDRAVRNELGLLAEGVKIHLSEEELWDEPIVLARHQAIVEFELSRAEFERDAEPLLARADEVVRRLLAKNPSGALAPTDVQDVILVGGTTRIPVVRRRLEALLGRPGRTSIDPMEVVALGAAYQAEHAQSSAVADLLTLHSLTKNLGVRCAGLDGMGIMRADIFSCLLKAGTKIPCRHTETYSTVIDGQPSVKIEVYELDALRERVEGYPLDEKEIRGLPAEAPAGSYEINVTFDYSVDQRLTITVAIPRYGVEQEWVTRHERRLRRDHASSKRRVGIVLGDTARGRLDDLVERARNVLRTPDRAPEAHALLERLVAALDDDDLDLAESLRTQLLRALDVAGVRLDEEV